MTIYDRVKFKCRTFIESINLLFTMGSELEQEVDTAKSDITDLSDITATGTTVNNIVHKDGTETITGTKSMTSTDNDVRVKTTPDATTSAVNQAYVESTVDGVNNLVHKSGNEIISGTKTIHDIFANYIGVMVNHFQDSADTTTWRKVYEFNMTGGAQYHHVFINVTQRRSASNSGIAMITINRNTSASIVWLAGNNITEAKFVITKEADNIFTLWYNSGISDADGIETSVIFEVGGNGPNLRTAIPADSNWYPITSSGYTDSENVSHSFLDYVASVKGVM